MKRRFDGGQPAVVQRAVGLDAAPQTGVRPILLKFVQSD